MINYMQESLQMERIEHYAVRLVPSYLGVREGQESGASEEGNVATQNCKKVYLSNKCCLPVQLV